MAEQYDLDGDIEKQKRIRENLLKEYKNILEDAVHKLNRSHDKTFAATSARDRIKLKLRDLIKEIT